ncbi:MAG: sulfatase-like hydrolase/transferase [Verrucomicrobia bacterium]|jgi:arylsulfatase A-like enzyme|nr:sulfatase-like hydrolase/transferase [Verrucomicrobiota bacterium]MDB4745738.1 sulfatase-like hydrolase/transferase [Verrucomicrobiota bacterium]
MPTFRLSLVLLFGGLTCSAFAADRPNILWLSAEDISSHIGCFGDPHAITPHLDRLATEGVRYTRAFTTAGVCAPCRSGIITGMYQTTLGTQHMRSRAKLPSFIKPFTTYLRESGYYCSNNSKTDYQFEAPKDSWDESNGRAHWRGRKDKSQPFFSVFNFGGCHESGIANDGKYRSVTEGLDADQRQDAKNLSTFPPYYPETPAAREDWKRNYELITAMDAWAGDLIQQLKDDGLYENTIIFFWSDHGVGLPRAKRWLYDSGTHIPLIVRTPEAMRLSGQGEPNRMTDQLVSSIDFGPTVLNLAGLDIPGHVQGQPFLGRQLPSPRSYVYGARDRMDERYDIIRMVRDKRFKYIRNYEPLKTFYQYMNTPEKGATMTDLRRRHEAGTLRAAANYFFSPNKPVEELYDTETDPHELMNLASDPNYASRLANMRKAHLAWVTETKDLGLIAEPLLVDREKAIGHRYGILRQGTGDDLSRRVARVAALASEGKEGLSKLVDALEDEDAAVRYWGAVGVANIGLPAISAEDMVRRTLKDPSAVVRTAAANALCRLGKPKAALPILVSILAEGEQWERLHAAIVLDEIDEQARPVVDAMHKALRPRQELYAKGKYTVRVINRALNQLEGTKREVN